MTYRLKDRMMVPPGGYSYTQVETGRTYDGQSLEETVQFFMKHRASNSLARTSHDEVLDDVEDQICKRLGFEWCKNMAVDSWGFQLTWDSIVAGTKTLAGEALSVLTGGEVWCSQQEAERRAEICSRCFANQRGGGCMGCGFMDRVRDLIGKTCSDQRTKCDDRLQSCLVCGCLLQCKVHYPSEVLKAGMSEKQRQAYADVPHCWMNQL